MRERLCRCCGNWHEMDKWPSQCFTRRNTARSDLGFPMIKVDACDPVQSMADGNWYTSKALLRETYKATGNPQGVEYIEVGDQERDYYPEVKRATKEDLKETVEKAEAAIARGEAWQPSPE